MGNRDERISHLAQEYAENKVLISCLRAKIKRIGEQITSLGQTIVNSSQRIELVDSETVSGGYGAERVSVHSLADLHKYETLLTRAEEERVHLESRLKEEGLDGLIS